MTSSVFDLFRGRTAPPDGEHFKLSEIRERDAASVSPLFSMEAIEAEYSKLQSARVDLQADFDRLATAREKLREDYAAKLAELEAEYSKEYDALLDQARNVASRMQHLQSLVIERAKCVDLKLAARSSHGLPVGGEDVE